MDVFSPSRLTLARQRRALFKKDLAQSLGVSNRAITGFEEGSYSPEPELVHKMSFVLQFPLGFFYASDVDLISPDAPSFRARRSLTATIRDKVLASGVIATDILAPAIDRRFLLPQADLPDLSQESPEVAASLLRAEWNLGNGPIHNMVHLLEAKGVQVFWLNEPAPEVDAFCLWRGGKPFVILNANKMAGDRARFDAAHELAHLVLHRDVELIGRDNELEAHQFAAAFLLPAEQFGAESPRYPMLELFYPLKQKWGVAIQAMVRRSKDLGILTEWQYNSVCRDIAKAGMRTKEPIPLPRETSKLHEMMFEHLAKKGISPEEFAKDLNLAFRDVADLMPAAKQNNLSLVSPSSATTERNNSPLPQEEQEKQGKAKGEIRMLRYRSG